jgi:hypothetical protein
MKWQTLRPRFSLRTLLAFMLLCAAGLAIWPLIPTQREAKAMKILESDPSIEVAFQDASANLLTSEQLGKAKVTDIAIDLYGPDLFGPGLAPAPSQRTLAPLADLWSLERITVFNWGRHDIAVPRFPFHRGPRYLFLCECNLDRPTLDSIAENLPNLEQAIFHPNEHTVYSRGTFAKFLAGRKLRDVAFEHVVLDAMDLQAIAHSGVKKLSLEQCTFNDRSFSFLAKSGVEELYFGPSEESIESELRGLKQCPHLRELWIGTLSFDHRCLDEIAELKEAGSLKKITLYIWFTPKIERRIRELKLLEAKAGIEVKINRL